MNSILSAEGQFLLGLENTNNDFLSTVTQLPDYTVIFVSEGSGTFFADHGDFSFTAPVLLFASPLQSLLITPVLPLKSATLQFHGDFYCIEYHRLEVACNGLLFNNIYRSPCVAVSPNDTPLFQYLFDHMTDEISKSNRSNMVLQACLQLILAKASNIKLTNEGLDPRYIERDELMEQFIQALDNNFLSLHKPSDYADLLSISTNYLNKRCRRYFRKSPSQLIQDRLIQEAKKYLYLTDKSVKEIANILRFKDESYFSRYFKNAAKVSPLAFRNKTGVSIVADLYR
jgi:AraC family transcriptional activator of pobA